MFKNIMLLFVFTHMERGAESRDESWYLHTRVPLRVTNGEQVFYIYFENENEMGDN
jgi:hypothetical protein